MRFPREAQRQFEKSTGQPLPYVHYILPDVPIAVGYIIASSPTVVLPDTLVKLSQFEGFPTKLSCTFEPAAPGSRVFLITLVQGPGPSWLHWPDTEGVVQGMLVHADATDDTEGARRETGRRLAKLQRRWRVMGRTGCSEAMADRALARLKEDEDTATKAVMFALKLTAALGNKAAARAALHQRLKEQNIALIRELLEIAEIEACTNGAEYTDLQVFDLAHAAHRAIGTPDEV